MPRPAASADDNSNALWLIAAILIAACASASLVFACATPFAAFAVLAAAVLPPRLALSTIGAVWLVNQAIGFGLLGYPRDLNAGAWGLGMLAAALIAVAAAAAVFRRFAATSRYAVYPVALVLAYAAYEIALLLQVPLLGGGDAFSPEIVGRLAFVNAVWLIAVVLAYEALRRLNAGAPSRAA